MQGDGDGWLECDRGHRHWGTFGAAGLLLFTAIDGRAHVLLQHRAAWCHHGDTWGIPGGARDSHESAVAAALREAGEEAGIDASRVTVHRESVDDHGGWRYTTVLAYAAEPPPTTPNRESQALVWLPVADVNTVDLHPGFGATWPSVRARGVRILIDTANVVGSRPTGWWRDRAGSTTTELIRLSRLWSRLVSLSAGDDGLVVAVIAVLEGEARAAENPTGIETVHASGSGDDTIVAVAERLVRQDAPPRDRNADALVVVTADRALRRRLPQSVQAVGPSWLSDRLSD